MDNRFQQVSFVISSLGASQVSYCCINSCNTWLDKNLTPNLSLFFQENAIPCVQPKMPRFHIRDMIAYDGHLIATSFLTARLVKNAHRAKKYFYINSLDWLDTRLKYSQNMIDSILCDDNIVKFTRCQDYLDKLTKDGININKTIVEDFDIQKILEIINGTR